MITLSPFLKGLGAKGAGKDGAAGEKQAEALSRIISVLLQGIAIHGFNYEPAVFASFENSIRKLRADFERATVEQARDETDALMVVLSAIRLLEEHNESAARHVAARQNEFEAVVGMLSETALQIARAAPEVMVRVKEIERDIARSSNIEAMSAARARLTSCMEDLRAEALADPQHQLGNSSGDQIDQVTGLPDARHAATAFSKVWNRRMEYYAAVFSLERLEAVNLRFGFQAGDQMLAILGGHIAQHLMPGDQLFRWRGPCLVMLMERRVAEPLVATELGRIAPARLESAIAVREREVMVPISASWNLLPLNSFSNPEELARKLNEFAAGRPRVARKFAAAAM
jgi:GGDEF domain-containing protein